MVTKMATTLSIRRKQPKTRRISHLGDCIGLVSERVVGEGTGFQFTRSIVT